MTKTIETNNEYHAQADIFMKAHGIAIKFFPLERGCPQWNVPCDHRHGHHYRVIFRKGQKSFRIDYWNSLHDSGLGIEPHAYDVLASITKDDPGSFEDFCPNFGYDTDSRRAERTYRSVVKEWNKVKRFFTPAELEELAEIQ